MIPMGKKVATNQQKRREKGFVCFLSDKHSGRKDITLSEEMIASQQFVNKCEKKLQLLDVVLCCSQRKDVFGWLLHLGEIWSASD